MTQEFIGSVVGRYNIVKYVSSGSFGDVYIGECNEKKVAIKIPNTHEYSSKMLRQEINFYNSLNNNKLVSCGISDTEVLTLNDKEVLVMDFLGDSLEKVLSKKGKFSLQNVIHIAINSIEIMYYIHSKGITHRDIKPDNFLIKDKLYCIDFGLSKSYLKNTKKHISFKEGYHFKGTGRFASLAAHKGYEQSRKDDLESLGYMFIYLLDGRLPWQGHEYKDKKKKYNAIMNQKLSINEDTLCKNAPKQFSVYLKYVKSLDFEEKPRYSSLIKMFKDLYTDIYKKNYDTNTFFLDL